MAEFLETTYDKFIFRVKPGYLYSQDDYWVDLDGNMAKVGVTDYLQKSSGDVAFVEPASSGINVRMGEKLGEMETIKVTVDLISPVAGRVVEVNGQLESHPELINNDPYGCGWLCRIELADPEGTKEGLLGAEAYLELMKGKIERGG